MIRIRKYHVLLLTFLISSVSTTVLLILLNISHKSLSIYHIFIPSFKRELSAQSKNNTLEETAYDKGNIKGIISKLPYIQSLGVDYLYLSPFFKSPLKDDGYDVTDYYKVNPLFGTDADFLGKDLLGVDSKDGGLLREADKLGLKVIIDLVMNHTSYTHEWFEAAINNLGKKHEEYFASFYYIFKEDKDKGKTSDGTPLVKLLYRLDGHEKDEVIPIPWWNDSGFNDNVGIHPYTCITLDGKGEIVNRDKVNKRRWECEDDSSDHYYYLYTFSSFQPDLNWNNPEVRKEMAKVANFWIKKGVKGFRLDAITLIGKDINKPLTVPNPKKLDDYLSEFKLGTYEEINDFLTIGELSQQEGKASQHKVS